MKRPSFQFYPADWKNNSKLRRCSEAARGAWIDVLCLLHDCDEYGVCRWSLDELSRAAGVPLKLVKELVAKEVLKGAEKNAEPFVFTPRHAGKDGESVVLVVPLDGPCWYSSRLVRDEYVRQNKGKGSRFDTGNQPPKSTPSAPPNKPPNLPPMVGIGEVKGDGSTSTSSSTYKNIKALSGKPDSIEVLDYLNAKTGRAYQAVSANLKLIDGRLAEATLEQCKAVVDDRVARWGNDPKMDEYLRPKTLFNATNFAQYVGELRPAGEAANESGEAWRRDPKFRGAK